MASYASAEPQKRLFISLLTRDISLADAVLDLIDNSINSAIIAQDRVFSGPSDYLALLDEEEVEALPEIRVKINETGFSIRDTCGGISLADAKSSVFKFGRDSEAGEGEEDRDTLSVYGIGLKRAIFKIGDRVQIESRHSVSGFTMDLRVGKWESLKQARWQIPIGERKPVAGDTFGTDITITHLFPDIMRRVSDGTFEAELARRVGRTYCYFLNRVIRIFVNDILIPPVDVKFRENTASDTFDLDGVQCAILAGIAAPEGKFYTSDTAGWYVFCNGRAVAFADKTPLTGWGTFLPSFQPKHRPFAGLVFFTAVDAEKLPWTTTKASINQESAIWQHAIRVMGAVGKQITSYLDSRYSSDGTEISSDELAQAGGAPASALRSVSSSVKRSFAAPKTRADTTSIQFSVRVRDLTEIKTYLGRRGASNGEIGRVTFDYYLKNVVRE